MRNGRKNLRSVMHNCFWIIIFAPLFLHFCENKYQANICIVLWKKKGISFCTW